MEIRFESRTLTKLHPLTISRGTSTGSENLFSIVTHEGVTGVGECAPGVLSDYLLAGQAESAIRSALEGFDLKQGPHSVTKAMQEAGIEEAAAAAVDTALWDWLAQSAELPLYRMLGLPAPSVPTSVTAGIDPSEIVREKANEFLSRTGAKFLKVKLGYPGGIEEDEAGYLAARQAAQHHNARLRVDANGGWTVAQAIHMGEWLAAHDCDYIEQPLAKGEEEGLPEVFAARRLPIFLDESVRTSRDVPQISDRCDGVNLKLMKTGGITEALRLVATARAHGLSTMIGCMGESSVAIAAGAAISGLFDHVDLDSHLNLVVDPASGLSLVDGVVTPPDTPGHGVRLSPG
ncbi:MAG: dipeptide epimerase [Fimbriimonadaceae bacterium]